MQLNYKGSSAFLLMILFVCLFVFLFSMFLTNNILISKSFNGGEGEIPMDEAPAVAAEVEKNGVD